MNKLRDSGIYEKLARDSGSRPPLPDPEMTVCTFYAQLGNFGEVTKITSFWGNSWRFPAGKKLPASVENRFHSETIGFVYVRYSLLQVQLNL